MIGALHIDVVCRWLHFQVVSGIGSVYFANVDPFGKGQGKDGLHPIP